MEPRELPEAATVCTVRREGQAFYVNCAGFKHPFRSADEVAKYLDIPWQSFAMMVDESPDVLILLRKRKGPWRSSRLPLE
jgi:hypothetical protein